MVDIYVEVRTRCDFCSEEKFECNRWRYDF